MAGFVEDNEGWEPYIKRMAKDGEWAGNMEVRGHSPHVKGFRVYGLGLRLRRSLPP